MGDAPECKLCEVELENNKCPECGAWTDSYGLQHQKACVGGFHEECDGDE
jgi:hypothetical protein